LEQTEKEWCLDFCSKVDFIYAAIQFTSCKNESKIKFGGWKKERRREKGKQDKPKSPIGEWIFSQGNQAYPCSRWFARKRLAVFCSF